MTFTTYRSQIRTIRQDNPCFRIVDKFVTAPRAGFEISEKCPAEYQKILYECWENGWLKPVAYMTERELIFMGLTND